MNKELREKAFVLLMIIFIVSFSSCSPKLVQSGKASYYADKFSGRKTSSGVVFRQYKRTAAHKTLPFGTKVKVVNMKNGKHVKVTINDRGPFVEGRVIDLSKKAAKRIGMIRDGVVDVQIKYKKTKAREVKRNN